MIFVSSNVGWDLGVEVGGGGGWICWCFDVMSVTFLGKQLIEHGLNVSELIHVLI